MNWRPRKNVVVPIDFSEPSLDAVNVALEMVEDTTHLHIIHVLTPIYPTEPGIIWETINFEERKKHALTHLKTAMEKRGIEEASFHILEGNPGQVIARLADEIDADLIVIPSHGRTGLKRLLIGSVAERVVRLSPCPVLVLRRPKN